MMAFAIVRELILWILRVILAITLLWTVNGSDGVKRLPLSPAWTTTLNIFCWQEILFLCCLIIGVSVLVNPEDPEVYNPSSIQYICLAVALGLARQHAWFYYFVSAATLAYYGHIEVPDSLVLAWLILVIFLLLLTPASPPEEIGITFSAIQIYVSFLAGNFWGIAMGFSMIFNYTRKLHIEMNGMLEVTTTRAIICGCLVSIICSIFYFNLMQDQSTIYLQDFSPVNFHHMQFFPQKF